MTREQIRAEINSRPITDYISLDRCKNDSRRGSFYQCPICKAGHRTGTLHIKNNRVICFSGGTKEDPNGCFGPKGEDTLGALRRILNTDENGVFDYCNLHADNVQEEGKPTTKPKVEDIVKPLTDKTEYYKTCHETLLKSPEAMDYLTKERGLDIDTINRFNLGYDPSFVHENNKDKPKEYQYPTPRIIMPRDKFTFQTRELHGSGPYKNMLQGSQKTLFNTEALANNDIIFVVEGEIDAMSIYQEGYTGVIALGTLSNACYFYEKAFENSNKAYIIALDNDPKNEDGSPTSSQQTQEALCELLSKANICYVNAKRDILFLGKKDSNAALLEDANKYKENLERQKVEAERRLIKKNEEYERTHRNELSFDEFITDITNKDGRLYEPIKTGIKDIDIMLGGGFMRRTLVTLGAGPGMGKTALAQWIFETMAKEGHDILYINLEMDKSQLLARSLSRYIYKYEKKDISALEVLRGYKWSSDQEEAILRAAKTYKEEVAMHFLYNPSNLSNDIESILSVMTEEEARLRTLGRKAPIVCIDYLQLIEVSKKADAMEKMKEAVKKLKDYAIQHNTLVFVIVANNRSSNKEGKVEQESARDTSAIEYTGDLMLGLSYTAIEEGWTIEVGKYKDDTPKYKTYDLELIRNIKRNSRNNNRPIPEELNQVTLKILKSRFSQGEGSVNLKFDGRHSTFNLIETRYTDLTNYEDGDPDNNPFND